MTRADLIRSGQFYQPTPSQRVEIELASLAFRRFIERLRVARAVEQSPNVVLLQRAADKAAARRFCGEPPATWLGSL